MLHPLITSLYNQVIEGAPLTEEQGRLLAALDEEHTTGILFAAGTITRAMGRRPFTCSITNAKSGTCSQDCRFCAQSGHYSTGSPTHPLLPLDELIGRGLAMHEAGARCYSLVTSGLMLASDEIDRICRCAEALKARTNLELSASLGLLSEDYARRLASAGLTRYHHNLETSRSYFPSICTTHSYDQDIATIRLAMKHGLNVCSGGILGLGESWAQRVELAATLAELGVDPAPEGFLDGTELLSLRLADGEPHQVEVRRMGEHIQNEPGLLEAIRTAGALPGRPVRAVIVGRSLVLGDGDSETVLPATAAEHLFVADE